MAFLKQICRICKLEKDLNEHEYYRDSQKKSGFKLVCKSCAKQQDREKNKNKEKTRERNQQKYLLKKTEIIASNRHYYQTKGGKEKERQRNSSYQQEVISRLGGECTGCHRTTNLVIDHVHNDENLERKKLSKVGLIRNLYFNKVDSKNYQLLCHNCNEKKRIKFIEQQVRTKTISGRDKLCPSCQTTLDRVFFHHSLPYQDKLYYECVFCTSNRRKEIKQRVIDLYGGHCQNCQETDLDVLCIDHLDSIGKYRESHGYVLYNRILNGVYDRNKFQVLCFNCNQKKHGSSARTENYYFSELKLTENQHFVSEALIDFDFDQTDLKLISPQVASQFLDKYHYDKYGRSAKFSYGVHLNDQLTMVIKFCSPTRQGTAKTVNLNNDQVLELDRLCVHPAYHKKNFVSWVLARVIKDFKLRRKEIKVLVSFADPSYGHLGTIYKASNWTEFGKTAKSYVYQNEHGKIIKKKNFYDWIRIRGLNKNRTELEVAQDLGLKRIYTEPKIKFIYQL